MALTATKKKSRRRQAFTRRDKFTLSVFVGVPAFFAYCLGLDSGSLNHWIIVYILEWSRTLRYQVGRLGKLQHSIYSLTPILASYKE